MNAVLSSASWSLSAGPLSSGIAKLKHSEAVVFASGILILFSLEVQQRASSRLSSLGHSSGRSATVRKFQYPGTNNCGRRLRISVSTPRHLYYPGETSRLVCGRSRDNHNRKQPCSVFLISPLPQLIFSTCQHRSRPSLSKPHSVFLKLGKSFKPQSSGPLGTLIPCMWLLACNVYFPMHTVYIYTNSHILLVGCIHNYSTCLL